jgi:hypothetical protein
VNEICNRGSFEILNPVEEKNWDDLISAHPDASFFHTAAWARVLCDTYGYQPSYFVVRGKNRVVSLIPLIEVNSWLTGKRGVALPFTDSCEPLGCDGSFKEKIVSAIKEYGKQRSWKYLECRWNEHLFGDAPAWNTFFSHQLQLDQNPEALLPCFSDTTRRAIKKSKNGNVKVEVHKTLEAIRAFYSLHCRTRKRHGLPPQPFRFFLNIHKHVLSQNFGFVVLAKVQQTIIAAGVYFHFGKQAIYKFGASDCNYQHLRANNAVMWEAIQWCCRNGFEKLHFGRTSLANEGLRRFKLGWGGQERKIDYFRYDFNKDIYLSGRDDAFGWHNHIFNHLPIPSLRLVGAMIYKHLA